MANYDDELKIGTLWKVISVNPIDQRNNAWNTKCHPFIGLLRVHRGRDVASEGPYSKGRIVSLLEI